MKISYTILVGKSIQSLINKTCNELNTVEIVREVNNIASEVDHNGNIQENYATFCVTN